MASVCVCRDMLINMENRIVTNVIILVILVQLTLKMLVNLVKKDLIAILIKDFVIA